MTNIANKQMICNVLMDAAKTDKDIVVLCSDSRGSASATPFANAFPEQFVEVGIAEQDLVGIAAGMARCGKRTFLCHLLALSQLVHTSSARLMLLTHIPMLS